jgi:hypothetical protein
MNFCRLLPSLKIPTNIHFSPEKNAFAKEREKKAQRQI